MVQPYFAPAYFSPTFFEASQTNVAFNPSTLPTPYNAPSYFAATYFYSGAAEPGPATNPSGAIGRDWSVFAVLMASLKATGAFASVSFGESSGAGQAGAALRPAAIVLPGNWEESDATDPTLLVRRVVFSVRLIVRVDATAGPFDQLDRLSSTVQRVVDGSSLGGNCLPALSKIRSGRYGSAQTYPEWSVELTGEFSTLIDPAEVPDPAGEFSTLIDPAEVPDPAESI